MTFDDALFMVLCDLKKRARSQISEYHRLEEQGDGAERGFYRKNISPLTGAISSLHVAYPELCKSFDGRKEIDT